MKEIIQIIENRRQELTLSKADLAEYLGFSRTGFYKAIGNPSSMKISTFAKLCNKLNLDIQSLSEIISLNSVIATKRSKLAIEKLQIEAEELVIILGVPLDQLEFIFDNNQITYSHIKRLSVATHIPTRYFLQESYKAHDNIELYIEHKELFDKYNLLGNFFLSLSRLKIETCKLINEILFAEQTAQSDLEFEYIENIGEEIDMPLTNIHVSILIKGNKRPIVMISNLPTDRFFVEHFIEHIFIKIKNRFLKDYKCNEIVWVYSTYLSKKIEDRITNIVKFDGNFLSPKFFSLYDYKNKKSDINKKGLEQFLNYKTNLRLK